MPAWKIHTHGSRTIVSVRGPKGTDSVACARGVTMEQATAALRGVQPPRGHHSNAGRLAVIEAHLRAAGLLDQPVGRPPLPDERRLEPWSIRFSAADRAALRAAAATAGISVRELIVTRCLTR